MFDQILVVDWSAANTPKTGSDSIWIGLDDGTATNPATRHEAEDRLIALCHEGLAAGKRLLIGVDFALGYPAGFARAVTGSDDPFVLWDWLDHALIDDARNRSNRFEVAAKANAALPGIGPFWFNPLRTEIEGLPRFGRDRRDHGFPDLRACERLARGAQSVWKLGGPGSVGSQALTGIPRLVHLRRRFPGQVAVWPFEAPRAPIVIAEVFPSLLGDAITAATRQGIIKDRAQTTLLARSLRAWAEAGRLEALFEMPDAAHRDEGWILGIGHEAALGETALGLLDA